MNIMKEKAIILAIETSSRKGSVAIACNEKMLAEKPFSSPLKHSAEIFPSIRDLLGRHSLNPNQIEHVYISGGPGSFTGLRIAATIAKMMQLANSIKIVSVDTLDVIAANVIDLSAGTTCPVQNHKLPALSTERIAAVLDAKRGQFFIAVYECRTGDQRNSAGKAIWKKILPDSLMTPSQFLEKFAHKDKPIRLLGDGLLYYKDKFQADGVLLYHEKYWSSRASNVLLLGRQMALKGQFTDALTLTPNYLRKPEVTIKNTLKHL
jgi:tRNA threonylcarbamoyladenosine biosynthesis protein TsaB